MAKPTTRDDDEFLRHVQIEQDEGRLELRHNVAESGFHKIMKRLIEEPPAPKQKRGKRGITESRGKRKQQARL